MILAQTKQYRIIDDAAILGSDQHILPLAYLALVQIPRSQEIGEGKCVGARDLDLTFHAHIPDRDIIEELPVFTLQIVVSDGQRTCGCRRYTPNSRSVESNRKRVTVAREPPFEPWLCQTRLPFRSFRFSIVRLKH